MDWKQNDNGNFVANTPRGSQLVVYQVKDEYGSKTGKWSWVATSKAKQKKFADKQYEDYETARDIMLQTITVVSQDDVDAYEEIKREKDTFNYDMVDMMGSMLTDGERRAFGG